MKRAAKNAAAAGLTSTAIVASLIGLTATSASALTPVNCGAPDYVRVTIHHKNETYTNACYTGGGGEGNDYGSDFWVTEISTGNNRVQWFGDGRWQPDQPIPAWTVFTWPNHPGGVSINKIRVV